MADPEKDAQRERSLQLFFERWLEQVKTSFVPRRARTLAALSAVDELLALAETHVRSGGQTRPSVDPRDGGHGVAMLPDVAAEALDILGSDEILKREYAARRTALMDVIRDLQSKENVRPATIEQARSMTGMLRRGYLAAGFRLANELIASGSRAHSDLIVIVDAIVSELRSAGHSDEGLRDAAAARAVANASSEQPLQALESQVSAPAATFECYVAVSLPQRMPAVPPELVGFSFVEQAPRAASAGRAMKAGPYLRAEVVAHDAAAAATIARQQSLATMGALKVFVPGSQGDVTSEVVGVVSGGSLHTYEVEERLPEEARSATDRQLLEILRSSWKVHELRGTDPLHDAIRLRHRALVASDSESRLLLLWSGIERMTSGAAGFNGALSAARDLVSHAVVLGKLRRDIGDLSACFEHHLGKGARRDELLKLVGKQHGNATRVDRELFLQYLMGPEEHLRKLVAFVFDTSPLLAFRCRELWKALGSGDPERVGGELAEYHERSRERISRQVARIYRARNRIAHLGASPDRVRDLVWHAHFYLTQLMAICVHYQGDAATAQELLVRRQGQYQAFLRLLKAGDPSILTANALLRPSRVVS